MTGLLHPHDQSTSLPTFAGYTAFGAGLDRIRLEAERRLSSIHFPTRKDENFRYLPLQGLAWNRVPANALGLAPEAASGPPGLKFEAWERLSPEAAAVLPTEAIFNDDFFANLVLARWRGGCVTIVPKGIRVLQPLRIANYLSAEHEVGFFRNIIIVEDEAEVTVVEEMAGPGSVSGENAPLFASLTQVIAAPNSSVTLAQVQHLGPGVDYFNRTAIEMHSGAQVNQVSVILGGKRGQVRSETIMRGENARYQSTGVTVAAQNDQHDYWGRVVHQAPRSSSSMEFWTLATDRARAAFNGTIVIQEKASKTEALQRNRNLLLSQGAEIATLPKLEISTDDVKCSHGTSVSSLDDQQLYYLMSRGIEPNRAEELLIEGFTEPVFGMIPVVEMRQTLRKRVAEKFGLEFAQAEEGEW